MRVDAITLPLCLITLGAAACGCESKGTSPAEPIAQPPSPAERQPPAAPTPYHVARPAASASAGAVARPAPSAPPPETLARPGRVKY